MVARYQTPSAIRRAGRKRVVAAYLKKRGVRGADALAQKALAAAKSQGAQLLPAQGGVAAKKIVAELAEGVLVLKERVDALDEELGRRFFARPEARVLASFPGLGPILWGPSSCRRGRRLRLGERRLSCRLRGASA